MRKWYYCNVCNYPKMLSKESWEYCDHCDKIRKFIEEKTYGN